MTDDRFRNEILSLSTANAGWKAHVRHDEVDAETKQRTVEHEETFPVVAWAVVRRWWKGAEPSSEAEPVFLVEGSLTNATEYRRLHSDVTPDPGNPKTTVHITVEAPSGPEITTA